MFSSIFTTVDPNAPNFHSVTDNVTAADLFGELEPKDTEWTIGSGIVTETQIWYHSLPDGRFLLAQIIHSSVGMWYPTVQFTFKLWDPKTKQKTWKSINVTNFVTPPPSSGSKTFDKRSCKADEFSVIHHQNPKPSDPSIAESYTITASIDKDVQLSLEVFRPTDIPGFKLGQGPKGGFSYFGANAAKPDGYVIHRFWPRTTCSGMLVVNGQVIDAAGGTGMFIHAIQGMRPNLVAASWNFADFQSNELGGTSAVLMEFKTIDAYGRKGAGSGGVTVTVGSVVVGGKLVSVVGETITPNEKSTASVSTCHAEHVSPTLDPETSYKQPQSIKYSWKGPSVVGTAPGTVAADLTVDVGTPDAPKGLIEKVDVLAEIPYVIKAFVNYVAGTKPFIYQWLNPTTLTITAPGALVGAPEEKEKTVSIEGSLFNEATFIS